MMSDRAYFLEENHRTVGRHVPMGMSLIHHEATGGLQTEGKF